MSYKSQLDKAKPGYPFTARQRRQKANTRKTRKNLRKAAQFNKALAPRAK